MSASEPSVTSRRRPRLLVAAVLAVLGIAAASYGTPSGAALAEPGSPSLRRATMPVTPQSVQMHPANADADFGPGQCEPCVVSME